MEYQRGKNQSPLNQRQELPRAVNEVHSTLERFGCIQQARIGSKVYHHVQAEGNNTQQGMQSPNRELMPQKKARLSFGREAHSGSANRG